MMTINDCIEFLKKNDGYLLITHIRPDGDTLGCAAALCHVLRRMGKTAFVWPNPEITPTYEEWMEPYLMVPGFSPKTVVAVDVASAHLIPDGFRYPVDLCIDHHPTNEFFAKQTFCEPQNAACGETILKLSKVLNGGLDRDTANLLYIAVSTDTGCFVYGNTTAQTHLAAAELIDAGAEIRNLNKKLFRTFSYSRLVLESLIYAGLKRYHNGEINVATVTLDMMEKTGATEDDCEDLAALAGRIKGSRISVTIRELEGGESKISLRSDEFFDSSAICALHGGGGHRMAAGCSIFAPPEKARDIIVREIEEALA
jgi:phosphoesterase RecJ-like protein